jgi:DNA-binding NtrC family response regulator
MANEVAPISLDERLRTFEASLITRALTVSGGNKSKAARPLQVKPSTLGDRIRRCGLDKWPLA